MDDMSIGSEVGMEISTHVSLAIDVIQCLNRCQHCEATHLPRFKHMPLEVILAWAETIRQEADRHGISVNIGYNNSELLDYPQWRELLTEFGHDKLGPAFATNGRQIARHPELLEELTARGVQWLQLTLGGASPNSHDAFAHRHGAFTDILATARAAHAAGLHVLWNYIAYRPLAEIGTMAEIASSISAPYASDHLRHKGGIDQNIYLVKPQGEGAKMEHLRPTCADRSALPSWATADCFASWYGASCDTEASLVTGMCHQGRCIGCLESQQFGGSSLEWLVVEQNGDVYPYCHERTPHYLLGNLNADGLACIIDRFMHNPPPGLAIRRRGLPELAAQYGDLASDKLHNGCSLCRTLVQRALHSELR